MISFLTRRGPRFGLGVWMSALASASCSLSLGLDGLDSATRGGPGGGPLGASGSAGTGPGQGGASAGSGGAAGGNPGGAAGSPGAGKSGGSGSSGAGGGSAAGGSGGKSAGGAAGANAGGGGAPGNSIVLATGQKTPCGIGLDDLHVYWVNTAPAAIYRVLKTGGTPEALATSVELSDPRDVVVEGATLYWSEWTNNVIRKRDLAGGTAQTFVTGAGRVGAIASTNGIFYATDDRSDQPSQGTVVVVPAGSTGAQVLFAVEPLATGMAVAGNDLAWARNGSIAIGTTSGGPSVTLVAQPATVTVSGVALDQTNVYWVEDEMRIKLANRASGKVSAFYDPAGPLGRGDVVVDATHVYWTEPDAGTIRKQPK